MLTLDNRMNGFMGADSPALDNRRTVNTPVPMPVDDGIPADLRRAPTTDNVANTPKAAETDQQIAAAPSAGMIFLRRSGEHKHWVVQFTGCKAVQCDAVLDVPVPCNATLRDVLAWLGATYNGKLGGAWLLVAP